MFEYVYLARPDATIAWFNVDEARVETGRQLAREFPVDADLVIPVAAVRDARRLRRYVLESGIPFGQGFVEMLDVARTFIKLSETLRQLGIRLKLNALEHMIRGKRIVVVDELHRARQHPARPGPDAPRGGGAGGPRADLQPAGQVAVLLRHRLRRPGPS